MCLHEVPRRFDRRATLCETFFQPAVGLVNGDDQILLDGVGRHDLLEAALLRVQSSDFSDHKSGLLQCYLNGVPYRFGNLFDRIFRAQAGFLSGAVVDWIDVQWWPIFNIADAAVVVGGILIAIFLLREPVDDQPVPAGAEPDTEPDTEPVSTDSGGSDAGSDAGVRPSSEDTTGTGEPGAR